jgi:predicted GIY-YIG superfamily endonuclease
MSYFKQDWLDLKWTDWIPLKTTPKVRKIIPTSQGLYRIRADGYSGIIYIGQTTNLKRRTSTLSNHSHKDQMPFSDPHTAAPNLWVWRKEKGWTYEVSVTKTELSKQNREACESYLLWMYRTAQNESTLCNHGRFHPDYEKSKTRKNGKRGRELGKNETNSAGDLSYLPLPASGKPISNSWMGRDWSRILPLSNRTNVPPISGLYKIVLNNQIVYIGQTENLAKRIRSHNRRFKDHEYSYTIVDHESLYHQRHELENDLIGNYYQIYKEAPKRQFKRKN